MKLKQRKGIELNQAFGAVLVLVLVAVLVIIAIVMFATLRSIDPDTAQTTTNETTSAINATTYTVLNATTCGFNSLSVLRINNGTKDLALGGFTINSATGVIDGTSAAENGTYTVNVSYSNNIGGGTCAASEEMINQFGTYPALIGLVGTIIFLGLVIGVLVASFVFGGKGRV